MIQPHIKCKEGDVSRYVLLPGDPGRVLEIAKFLDSPKKVAYNREFLTYRGNYKGIDITVTSTGIGSPSAAIALEELANIGAKVFIRVGTCGALKSNIKYGDLIIPFAAVRAEGTTREYIDDEFPAVADPEVFQSLVAVAKKQGFTYHTGVNRTHDAFYEHINNMLKWGRIFEDKRMKKWPFPLVSSEMECSAIFVIGLLRGLKTGTVLAVNTLEPLDKIKENPDLIYHLESSPDTNQGIEKAIKVALESIVLININNKT